MWFTLTIIYTVIYGLINFLYKVASENNCSSNKILNISSFSVSLLSLIFIIVTRSEFMKIELIIIFALINSVFFVIGTISKMKSLKYISSSFAFPISKLNSIFVIIYALLLFSERPSFNQWIGIILSFVMLGYISYNVRKDDKKSKSEQLGRRQMIGVLLALAGALSTSVSMLTGKFVSESVPKLNFIFISYSMVLIYTSLSNIFVSSQ